MSMWTLVNIYARHSPDDAYSPGCTQLPVKRQVNINNSNVHLVYRQQQTYYRLDGVNDDNFCLNHNNNTIKKNK